jgi:hypothetical protein
MRCPACTQRNSVAAKDCKFCGQKFKRKTSPILLKVGAGVVAVGLVLGLASAVGSMFSGTPAPKLKPIAERMAAGPKSPEEAQIMRSELDNAVIKYLEQHGSIPSADLLTKLQTEVPSSAFEVLVFDLPNQIKLIELTCVLQPSDYLVVPSKSGPKVSRISNLQVFDAARLIPTTPEPCLVLLGHTTGDQPKQPQLNALAITPSGEVTDRTDKLFPSIKGTGSANFIGTSNNIKIERGIVSSAKDQELFDPSVNFKDEPFITNLTWKNGKYESSSSMGTNEVGALYAVASSLVDPTATESFRQQLSPEVRDNIKAMADKPVAAPGHFKISKVAKEPSKRRRSRRAAAEANGGYVLTSGDRAFEVGLVKAGRWSASTLKETKASEAVATQPVTETPEVTQEPVQTPVIVQESEKVVVKEVVKEKVKEPTRVAQVTPSEPPPKKEKKRDEPKPKKEPKTETGGKSGGSGKIVTETSSRVTMRTGPARHHKSIFDVGRGESVRILGEQNGWYKISVNGQEGWVYNSYVRKGNWTKSTEKVATKKESTPPPVKREPKKEREKEKVTASAPKPAKSKNKSQVSSSKAHGIDRVEHADEPDFVP